MPHKPRKLYPGGTIALVAPASTPSVEQLQGAQQYLESRGFKVVTGASCTSRFFYTAGTAADRVQELHDFFEDPGIDALFCVRGGFGTLGLLPLLDYELIAENPKLFCGFSDVTALQSALLAKAGLPSISGALAGVDFFQNPDKFTEDSFWKLVETGNQECTFAPSIDVNFLENGCFGTCIPGTLSLFSKLIGTPYLPDTKGTVLVLEDVEEPRHKIEGYLLHLAYSGWMKRASGVLYGDFTPPEKEGYPDVPSIFEILQRVMRSTRIPWNAGIPYGHIKSRISLPFGIPVSVSLTAAGVHLYTTESLYSA